MGAQHKTSKLEIRNLTLEAYASCTVFLGKKWIQGYCEDCGNARVYTSAQCAASASKPSKKTSKDRLLILNPLFVSYRMLSF